jgi:hypothetical protein
MPVHRSAGKILAYLNSIPFDSNTKLESQEVKPISKATYRKTPTRMSQKIFCEKSSYKGSCTASE